MPQDAAGLAGKEESFFGIAPAAEGRESKNIEKPVIAAPTPTPADRRPTVNKSDASHRDFLHIGLSLQNKLKK
ncbi:hypothetical protein [Solidesulfovibrio carbinoliphilus]|uniref:hypothetical protein n=1 Tax=Solidesulfovibrio carbinoliphilus TaxID=345370 RepID=UPI0012F4E10B|nr:hypothetical protein [Solidesulfovibrio carbinoliphilus]